MDNLNPLNDPQRGTYDRQHHVDEALMELNAVLRNIPNQQGKLRLVDEVIASLSARRTRIANGTEYVAETTNPQDTPLRGANDPVRSF